MHDFVKASGLVLVAIVFCLVLSGQNKHFSILISMAVCLMVATGAMLYLQPVLDFFKELQIIGKWNADFFAILLKATGIGIIVQIVSLICTDAGNTALAKSIQILGTAVTLWLSLPIFTELLSLVNQLLRNV